MFKKTLIIILLCLALFFRLYHIETLPPSLFYDEADAGYQAMVFNQHQGDYYGNKFPIHFHSFGDYRTSLHIYSIALFQKITGNYELSVRLPSAIFGTFTVLVIILITNSLIPGFLLTISPWAIHYSRIGFEPSGMILLITLSFYFWFKFIKKEKILYLYLTSLFLCLAPYYYSTAKLFILIIVLLFALIWWKNIVKLGIKRIILPFLFSLIILFPMLKDTLNGKAGFRFSYISIFSLTHREQVVDTLRFQDASINHPDQVGVKTSLVSSLFHNKYQLILDKFISNYLSSFSIDFLVIKGDDNPRHGFNNHGLIYVLDYLLFFIGLFSLFKNKVRKKTSLFFFYLLLLAPLPYALTLDSDSPHATRLILMLPSLIYFVYLGINFLLKKNKYFIFPIFTFYLLSFITFSHYYYYHYPNQSAASWNVGLKEAVLKSNDYQSNSLVFSNVYASFVSHFLFYRPYNLATNTSLTDHLVEISNESISGQVLDGNYYFGTINWDNLTRFPRNSIFIVPDSEVKLLPSSLILIEKIEKKYQMAQGHNFYHFKDQ